MNNFKTILDHISNATSKVFEYLLVRYSKVFEYLLVRYSIRTKLICMPDFVMQFNLILYFKVPRVHDRA